MLVLELANDGSHLAQLGGIELAGGLVEDHQRRFVDDRLRDAHPLFVTVGQAAEIRSSLYSTTSTSSADLVDPSRQRG